MGQKGTFKLRTGRLGAVVLLGVAWIVISAAFWRSQDFKVEHALGDAEGISYGFPFTALCREYERETWPEEGPVVLTSQEWRVWGCVADAAITLVVFGVLTWSAMRVCKSRSARSCCASGAEGP